MIKTATKSRKKQPMPTPHVRPGPSLEGPPAVPANGNGNGIDLLGRIGRPARKRNAKWKKGQQIPSISVHDPRLVKNQYVARRLDKAPGYYADEKMLVLAQAIPDAKAGVLMFTANEYAAFLRDALANLGIASEINTESVDLPKMGQRTPTDSRTSAIKDGWEDPACTPDNHAEDIRFSWFGVKFGPNWIDFKNGLGLIYDGGGRSQSVLDEYDPANADQHIAVQRNLIFNQINDLSGDPTYMLLSFLKHNRDVKRTTPGSVIAVENGVLETKPQIANSITSCKNRMAPTFLLKKVLEFPRENSWINLLGWTTEAGRYEGDDVEGKGKYNSLTTTFRILADTLDKCGVEFDQLPTMLDFGFRFFYKHCRLAVRDAIAGGEKFHFHTSLACKVITLLTAMFYVKSGGDENKFNKLVTQALDTHRGIKEEEYSKRNGTTKGPLPTMTPDVFFTTSKFFFSQQFNSGEVATNKLLKSIGSACKTVLQSTP